MRRIGIICFLAGILFYLLIVPTGNSAEKAGHECIECHKITNEEAEKSLRGIFPEAKVLELRAGPVKGLWEIAFEVGGQKGVAYIDSSREYLILGAVAELKTKANLTRERLYELSKIDVSKIPLENSLLMGANDAEHKVIVFDDPD